MVEKWIILHFAWNSKCPKEAKKYVNMKNNKSSCQNAKIWYQVSITNGGVLPQG